MLGVGKISRQLSQLLLWSATCSVVFIFIGIYITVGAVHFAPTVCFFKIFYKEKEK